VTADLAVPTFTKNVKVGQPPGNTPAQSEPRRGSVAPHPGLSNGNRHRQDGKAAPQIGAAIGFGLAAKKKNSFRPAST
jgi:hypothetical protein